ncbi:hypothetical protein CLV28_2507 [Sediminihabitans luteus]|uniref:Uncharacterized protein n=1 Tax=Sediminihabitans luteus TaxID=1138585 RepID=A0A2M9CDV2_9CELL|nr:hypothetical protein [Sediminihabitans luteus]PJJ70030.1 hypothetical protein CLV28_2507 [Sediminihabitans luteus]GIJ00186.1 hypothetical protein Slu03_25630 [Sediminihabitans luteus]
MRLYVPVTLDELDAVSSTPDAARWDLAPRAAHAVTGPLAQSYPDEDDEGLEFLAALEAADDSLALVAGRVDAPRQRAVVTVEVPDSAVEVVGAVLPPEDADLGDDPAPSAVAVVASVPQVAIVCVHVDETTAADDVAAVLAAADAGDDPALDAALDRVTERNLLWYDWSEIAEIPRA